MVLTIGGRIRCPMRKTLRRDCEARPPYFCLARHQSDDGPIGSYPASGRPDAFAARFPEGRSCAGFWTPASREAPRTQAAGVQKAPRHEVAGSWVAAGQRALWGFDASGEFAGGRETGATRAAGLDAERARAWEGRLGGRLERIDGRAVE